MNEAVRTPLGVRITGVDLADPDPEAVTRVRGLLAAHGVAVVADQDLNDEQFRSFLRQFGQLTFTHGETPVEGFPELNVVTNVGRTSPPRSTFHTDTSYVSDPPAYTALRAVQLPAQGGETLFTNQYRAFDTLPDDVRTTLAGRTIRHVVTGLDLGTEQETEADHPAFRRHPISGRTALYLSTPQRCVAISGLPAPQAADLIEFLFTHSTKEDNILRHAWSPGDVVMWDNACVMHRADHTNVVGDRVMHRGMVAHHG